MRMGEDTYKYRDLYCRTSQNRQFRHAGEYPDGHASRHPVLSSAVRNDGKKGRAKVSRHAGVIAGLAIFALIAVLAAGCAVGPKPRPVAEAEPEHLVLVDPGWWPDFSDDMDRDSLLIAVDRSLVYYGRLPENTTFQFGNTVYSLQEMKDSLLLLRDIVATTENTGDLRRRLMGSFDLYQCTGTSGDGNVLFTGYYEPVLRGSRVRTDRYRHPVYRTPDDHTIIDLGGFHEKFADERIIARVENGDVLPYFTRSEIDIEGRLEGRGLEIAWTDDPVELFFMHIQGSGTIIFENGESIQVSYDTWNGRPYRSLGRHLAQKGVLALAEMSLRGIKNYLQSTSGDDVMSLLAHNESYIFFRVVEEGPRGALGVPVTAGRTIATDPAFFPRGAIALISLKRPFFSDAGEISFWKPFSRLVLNQDAGGAIKGPGRVDLFWGTGDEAGLIAGYMKEYGQLYFLVKKR
ncbi:MAG TPA: transglycosylase [Deltaproteobacteria bacterium]|nr:transglycosylase [Deltaproteobacteria bacterium]